VKRGGAVAVPLAEIGVLPLAKAWELVSGTPPAR
jgi:hypothetical protein